MTQADASFLAGIQIGPHSLLDEGIERCLDFLQDTAAVDALFIYSQTYHIGASPLSVLATDHPGGAPRDPRDRKLPHLWMRLPQEPFRGCAIGHEHPAADREYAARDLFEELAKPCRQRGIKVYPRILEAGMRRAERIPGYERVATIDLDGRPGSGPCWNHPDYREWMALTTREMLKAYPVDGLQYGAERVGPLSGALFKGQKPECFCDHCVARNRENGADPERARQGYRRLYQLIREIESGEEQPDGVFATVLRVLFQYPEIISWNQQWLEADTAIQKLVSETAKAVQPEIEVGQHVDHQRSSWDIIFRAAVSYADMAPHNDFIKPIVYHDIFGPRLREWVIEAHQSRVLRDLSPPQALAMFYALFGHDPASEPGYEKLPEQGLSADYVYRETRRCVSGALGQTKVYAGIGIDVPHYVEGGMIRVPSDPEQVERATQEAMRAGAAGVVASREYEEMSAENLAAFGRAIQRIKKSGKQNM